MSWEDDFLTHMRTAPVEPKKRKPTRTPEQMMRDAVKHFKSLNMDGVQINPSKSTWIIWFRGNTFSHKDTLAANGCKWDTLVSAWYYIASNRRR